MVDAFSEPGPAMSQIISGGACNNWVRFAKMPLVGQPLLSARTILRNEPNFGFAEDRASAIYCSKAEGSAPYPHLKAECWL